jgi:uncharacterized membrane protein
MFDERMTATIVGALFVVATLVAIVASVRVLLTAPIAVNEMVLAVWLIVKGFQGPRTAVRPVATRTT